MSTPNRTALPQLAERAQSASVTGGVHVNGLGLSAVPLVLTARRHWQILLLVGVLLVLYAPVLAGLMVNWYQDPDYSHGFFVPLVSGYLIWRKRNELARLPQRPSFYGFLVVLCSLALLLLGSLGAELFLTRIAFLGTLTGLIIYFFGWGTLHAVSFPLSFLLLMIPLPVLVYNEIVFPLQFVASSFATAVLDTLNVFPVLREGNILVLPYHRIEVVEACSGIRSLMSLIALAMGYGYFAERSRYVRIMLVLAMIPLAVVSNGFRVVGTALLTYYWGPQAADGFLHSFSGWVIFMVAATLLLMLHAMIKATRGWRVLNLSGWA
jgi:exosortase